MNENNRIMEVCIAIFLFLGLIGFVGLCIYNTPPPKTLEQQRQERRESYHEAGKDIHEFIKGTLGK